MKRTLTLGLVVLFVGCGHSPRFEGEILVSSGVRAGQAVNLGIQVRNEPAGAHYVWTATNGACIPQETTALTTTFTPDHVGESLIQVEVFAAGRKIADLSKVVSVSDKPGERATPKDGAASNGASPAQPLSSQAPLIRITHAPLFNEEGGPIRTATLTGTVAGIENPREYRVVCYARTTSWFIQPATDAFMTQIADDHTFSCLTHLGTQYAALLVRPGFRSKAEPIAVELPERGDEVLDLTIVNGTH
jgi:hypothetical protein